MEERLLVENTWGLLGPEFLPSLRRTRTLGLGASVRWFNDLAVPGLGGVWYSKQLMLATLGVAVAEYARSKGAKVQNIEMANAIEALACWLAFKGNGWNSDSRLRGSTKLHGKDNGDFSFARVRQRNFYVTQPMRMATVQALPALGFVESDSARFNAFRCSDAGRSFVEQACKERPYNRSLTEHLSLWATGQDNRVDTGALRKALSPLTPFSGDTISLLHERLVQGGNENSEDKQRRRNALKWVEELRQAKPDKFGWDIKPADITDSHWHDLEAGAKFFSTREAAILVLDALEAHIGNQAERLSHSLITAIPDCLSPLLDKLKDRARAFMTTNHTDPGAISFCRDCLCDAKPAVLRSLVARDGHVLRLVGEEVKPGPAFRGSQLIESGSDGEVTDSPEAGDIPLPEGISYRMRNLYLLNLDLHGELDHWLNPAENGGHS